MICFHHNDLDGRCAAAVVYKWFRQKESLKGDERGDIVFIELDYKDRIPIEMLTLDEEIAIVDFSFKPEVMAEVLKRNHRIIWCDHHKTAIAYDYGVELVGIRDFADKSRAGCEVTWDFFFPHTPMPRAVFLVGDRDAWRWEGGEETAQFNQGMKIYNPSPKSETWSVLFECTNDERALLDAILNDGEACLKFRDSFCDDYAKSYGFETEFDGHKAFAIGLYMFGSECFGKRFDEYPMCLSFVYDGKQWTVGLYSKTIDVGEVARKHGGGGHKGAAGFICPELPFHPTTEK